MSKEKLLFILKRFLLLLLVVLSISGLMKLFGIDLEEMEKGGELENWVNKKAGY